MTTTYDRHAPFASRLLSRYRLNKTGSTKETWHVVLDLQGSGISYRPGDSIGICPQNDAQLVGAMLAACRFDGSEEVRDERNHTTYCMRTWLAKRANLAVCNRKIVHELAARLPEGLKKEQLQELLAPTHEEALKEFLHLWTVPELLQHHLEVTLEPQTLVHMLQPLLPRLYSIASSQACCENEVHLTVSRVRYEVHGRKRLGVCSHFLCDMIAPERDEVPIYLQLTKDFLLPEDTAASVIMIGPGTGIAPFRAFMQQRMQAGAHRGPSWLFFGERHQTHDFFYEEFWQELVACGALKLNTAFSRDQEEKIYVQHRLWQERKEIWRWLQEGARIYVCGDAERMAKDVDATLQDIVVEEGAISREAARAFLTSLRKDKRYLRDVY